MPTNQSYPWAEGNPHTCSNADRSTTATSVSVHPKAAVATKVPFCQTSIELSSRKDQAKASNAASSASLLSEMPVVLPAVSVWENGDEKNSESQFTSVPHVSPNAPQHLNGIQSLDLILATGVKQSGTMVTECSAVSSIPTKENHVGLNDTCVAPLAVESFLSNSELPIKGKLSLQQSNKLLSEAADCPWLPSVSPQCLTASELQGAIGRKDTPILDSIKVEKRSTRETMTTIRRSHSAKPAARCSQTEKSCLTVSPLDSQLLIRGGPPAVVVPASNKKPPTDHNKQSRCSSGNTLSRCRKSPLTASPTPNGCMQGALSASQEVPPAPLFASTGALVGSVTSQISTIHLTRRGESDRVSHSSPARFSPSACLAEETQLSGQECVMQVDGVEEELPDELENACSDNDSDCSSPSITVQLGTEQPMLLEVGDNREERPALVQSLFPLVPPTLYFSTANEKVELLPVEQRRLLKWKMTTVTPNVVKQTIARSHFRVTKKSHDWLGCWGHHMKSPGFKALGDHQKLNHFPGTFQIGRKDRLWRNLSKMQSRFGKQEFSFFPRTFILPQDIKQLRKAWEDSSPKQKWIVKPPASARGIGIQVIHKWSQMPRKRPLLVQKYLHKPYLISGNKFDLRIYVYVTSYDPLRIYIFSDGLVRFASCKYSSSMKTLSNKFMHLTNYSVNKKNSEYQTNSDDKACQGHKWALKALWQYLSSRGVNTTLIWEKIKDIVIKTIIASEPYVINLLKMHVRTPYSCHELFGFDIMLDENLKPWILEVNISPSLHSNSALDVSIKGQMVSDLLNLAGFRIPRREDVITTCSSASSSTSSLSGGNREKTKPVLSADEKVKHAFYLTQHWADQDFLPTVLDMLTPEDVRVLVESEDELSRCGQFERVFPSPSSSRYLRFFECPRYLNILLDQWEHKHRSNRSKGISLLVSLCEKGVHHGTSDPAHMWSKCSNISRVVVSQQHHSHPDNDDGSDREVASLSSLPASPSPGSSVTSSACASPQLNLSWSPLPQL